MKKVLILAYDFPPYVSVGGLRPYNWLKYLKKFGVEPIVVTRQWSNEHGNELDYISPSATDKTIIEEHPYGTVIRAPYFPSLSNRILLKNGEQKYRFVRKALTAFDEFRQFIWVSGPKKELYYAAEKYLKNHQVDAIIATGEPFVLFSFASKLSKQFNLPWIADYRDPWSQNKNRSSNFLLKIFYRHFEKKLLATSSAALTVSTFFEKQIIENIKNTPIHILPNGYDDELIDEVSKLKQSDDTLNIAFVGTIYKWHPWQLFIQSFCAYIAKTPGIKISLNFYGINNKEEVEQFISTHHSEFKQYFTFTPRLPNKEVLKHLANSNVMLLFNNYSIMGTKIYDYLGVKRKVLLCFSDDSEANKLKEKYYSIDEFEGLSKTLQADLITATKSGVVVKNREHLMQVLDESWTEFQEKGEIVCDSVGIEAYSRKIQVEKLARIIKELK